MVSHYEEEKAWFQTAKCYITKWSVWIVSFHFTEVLNIVKCSTLPEATNVQSSKYAMSEEVSVRHLCQLEHFFQSEKVYFQYYGQTQTESHNISV